MDHGTEQRQPLLDYAVILRKVYSVSMVQCISFYSLVTVKQKKDIEKERI